MSEKIKGLVVLFEHDLTKEVADDIIKLIYLIRGVAHVTTKISNPEHWLAASDAKLELRKKISGLLWD